MPQTQILLDAPGVARALDQLAQRISDCEGGDRAVVLLGIPRGGVPLAQRLAARLSQLWGQPVPVGAVDVAMHRDDLDQRAAPDIHPTVMPCDLTGRTVVLVDDVLCRGRTARAALDALNDFGRPRRVQLAALVDRGLRELPIQPDFVGHRIVTTPEQNVRVCLMELDGVDEVRLETA